MIVYHVQRDPENLTNSVVANYYENTEDVPETYAWVLDLAAYTADGVDPQIPDDQRTYLIFYIRMTDFVAASTTTCMDTFIRLHDVVVTYVDDGGTSHDTANETPCDGSGSEEALYCARVQFAE